MYLSWRWDGSLIDVYPTSTMEIEFHGAVEIG